MRNLTMAGLESVYLFIAEFNGFKTGTIDDKVNYGRHCYYTNTYPVEQATTAEDRKEFYETIWLDRIYKKLDTIFGFKTKIMKQRVQRNEITIDDFNDPEMKEVHWDIPIEIDMSASVLGYVGLLTNHKPFMERTNMLGDELVDAWQITGIPKRKQAKVIMQTIYGSSQTCQELWRAEGIEYTPEDIKAYNDALTHGEIAVGDRFSKFIISNCNPKETMKLHVWNETFEVECNRYRNVGEKTLMYDIYDTNTNSVRRIQNTETRKVADLDQFRRFFVTALIHNLDSQVINKVTKAVYEKSNWCLDIHDALIIHPNDADFARRKYADALEDIHENRNTILTNYFRSIGVPASAMKEWTNEVMPTVMPLEGKLSCSKMVLK